MNKNKRIIEFKRKACGCDEIIVNFRIAKFGNSAHIIVPKDFIERYDSDVIIGLKKKARLR